ncbi:SAF domain-containing protein [Nocardioides sp.]|uniref:SAF domain-containing protein n=1 Tax=Nocardioides sp. TaxID=35761 RepID=UPI002718F4FA|nr:SAF domain-containing protein [Nocardioides sp.]MDO9454778.1 SAF domain-containing protein [Nocardioides sp.]
MSTDTQPSPADQQRSRVARRQKTPKPQDRVQPPRQRRPALAALAVALIVGGALVAGLLAVRLDSREPVLAAARDIDAGSVITEDDLVEVQVASEGLQLIPAELADQILDGDTYARVPIRQGSLLDQNILTDTEPLADGRAVVSVPLNAALTPVGELRSGDLVSVVRISGGDDKLPLATLTEGLVLSVSSGVSDDLGESTAGSLSLLIPSEAALVVVDAAGTNRAGIALLRHNATPEDPLEPGDTDPPGASSSGDSDAEAP